jgi:hypothetical protein
MSTAGIDSLLDPLSACLDAESARRLADFRIDAGVQTRIDQLAERANQGLLSDEDRTEYETLINTAEIIAILQIKARRRLSEIVH